MEENTNYKISKSEKFRAAVVCMSVSAGGALIYKVGCDSAAAKAIGVAVISCSPFISYVDYTNQKIKKLAKFISNNFR